jgi:hypothetical protein
MKMKSEGRMKNRLVVLAALAALAAPTALNAGSLNPSAAPASTMRTLEELKPAWDQLIPGAQRFVNALDGTAVLDKETGLVWAKSPPTSLFTWQDATDYCTQLTLGGRKGWRLPTVEELASLVDPTQSNPPLPSGHPFSNVQAYWYWSSSTYSGDSSSAWSVSMTDGNVHLNLKTFNPFVWPVRGGE